MFLNKFSLLLLGCQYLRLHFSNALPIKIALVVSYGHGFNDLEYLDMAGVQSQIIKNLPKEIEDFTMPAASSMLSYRGILLGNLQLSPNNNQHIPKPNLYSIFTDNGVPTHHAGLWGYANLPDVTNHAITNDPNSAINATLNFIQNNENYFSMTFVPLVDINYIDGQAIYPNAKCIGSLPLTQKYCGGQIYQSSLIYEDALLGKLFAELIRQQAFVIWTTVHGGIAPQTHPHSQPRTSLRGYADGQLSVNALPGGSLYDGGIRTHLFYNPGQYQTDMRNDGNGIDFMQTLPLIANIMTPQSSIRINLFNQSAIREQELQWASFKIAEGSGLNTSPGRAKQITVADKKYKLLWDANRTEIFNWNTPEILRQYSGYEFAQAAVNAVVLPKDRPNYSLNNLPIMPIGIKRQTPKVSKVERLIFIIADDGSQDHSFLSRHSKSNNYPDTPNIDKLAKEGIYFKRYYTASVCSPARASVMTGRFNFHQDVAIFGVYNDKLYVRAQNGVPPYLGYNKNLQFLGKILQQNGIQTALVGKSHVANKGTKTPDYYGFGYFKCYECPAIGAQKYNQYASTFPGNSSLMIVDEALSWMKQQYAQNKPFFAYLGFKNSHVQINALPGQLDDLGYCNAQNPSLIPGNERFAQASSLQTFNGLVHEQDRQIGRIIDWLESENIQDSSAIIYTIDNGGEKQTAEDNCKSNIDRRGNKRSLYDGGINVPAIVWAPGLGFQGISNTLASVTDWYLTIPSLFGIDITKTKDYRRLDGKNLLPCLLQGNCEQTDQRTLLFEFRTQMDSSDCTGISPRFAIVKDEYKLLLDSTLKKAPRDITKFSRVELYHMPSDPFEFNNIAREHPEIVNEYIQELKAYTPYANSYWPSNIPAHNGQPQDKRLRVGFRCINNRL